MSGRLIALLCSIMIALTGCDHFERMETFSEMPLNDPYIAQEAAEVEIAGAQDGLLYLANSKRETYLLDSGDKLRVDIFGQENLSRIYNVDGGGYISIPLIGAVKARGISTFSLARRIASKLSEDYVKDPKVTVEISTYRPFFILGEVRNPGRFPYVNGMSVRTAVAIAGGYSPRAAEGEVTITRTIDGYTSKMDVSSDFTIKPGDTIYVNERFL